MFLHVSVCPQRGGLGVVSQHALQVVSKHALQQVSRGWYPSMPCRFPGPHPGGKLRGSCQGVVSRPTPKGEVEGDLAGGSPGPHLSQHALRQTLPPTATAACGTHPIGMHSCFILMSLSSRLLTFSSIMLTDLKDQI